MKIYRIAQKVGSDFFVGCDKLWSSSSKLDGTYQDIQNGNLSFSRGNPPIVVKSLDMRGAFFILDGHHQIMEDLMAGRKTVWVHWDEHSKYIDAGIGNEMPHDKIRVVDFLKERKQ